MTRRHFDSFAELSAETRAVLRLQGFEHATPVQEATIPLFTGNKDVSVDACTGSGKTLAFVLPVTERLRRLEKPLKAHQVGALIISPTRELAAQIFAVAAPYVASVPWARASLLVGGSRGGGRAASEGGAAKKAVDGGPDAPERGSNVLVGTPGRLNEVLAQNSLDLKSLEVLVLDEADRLLDMGFKKHLDAILARLPRQRRTGLFSATQTEAVKALCRAGLRNPVRVAVAVSRVEDGKGAEGASGQSSAAGERKTPLGLSLEYVVAGVEDKYPLLLRLLRRLSRDQKVMVYALTCATVDWLARALRAGACPRGSGPDPQVVWALHGRMKQGAREKMLAAFAGAQRGVLLVTDVAARGLDIPSVDWVVQADPPQDPDAFVHRAGRTARAGRSGRGVVFLMPHEEPYVEFLRLRGVPLVEHSGAEAWTEGENRGRDSGKENEDKFSAEHPPPSPPAAPPLNPLAHHLRRAYEQNRELMESAAVAYVSYVRGYAKHRCAFIFRLEELPLVGLARAMGLLRLPAMPELRRPGLDLSALPFSEVDAETVPYTDPAREKVRQEALLRRRAEAEARREAGPPQKAQARAAKKAKKVKELPNLPAAKRRQLQEAQDLGDLESDYKLLKRHQKKRVSEKELEKALFGYQSCEDDESDGEGSKVAAKKRVKKLNSVQSEQLRKAQRKKKRAQRERKREREG